MPFDPMEPFADPEMLKETVTALGQVEWKLYGKIPIRMHRGEPTEYEFDLRLGTIHFTEQDFHELAGIFERLNRKWGTSMTFCVYPSKEAPREMILNVRGSPLAPAETD